MSRLSSLQTQVTAFALAVSLLPLGAISWYILSSGEEGLQVTTDAANEAINEVLFSNLSGQVASKKATITQYLDTAGQQLLTFASNDVVMESAHELSRDVARLTPIDATPDVQRQTVAQYYHREFGKQYLSLNYQGKPAANNRIYPFCQRCQSECYF